MNLAFISLAMMTISLMGSIMTTRAAGQGKGGYREDSNIQSLTLGSVSRTDLDVGGFDESPGYISISIDRGEGIEMQYEKTGHFASLVHSVTVSTDNQTGYSLSMRDLEGSVHLETMMGDRINAVEGNLTTNSYGYTVNEINKKATANSNVFAVSENESILGSTEKAESHITYVNWGLVLDDTLPGGTYSNEVVYTAVAH
ncbi:MAG: hypothetical protein LBQ95_05095 [Lachnospiraceae bacterium]|nr:hypothetical protein [Lachnospiraceae bacterium]